MKTIILAGGSGTRLWPLSREMYPKQFVKFFENSESLFQQTFKRCAMLCGPDNIYVVTNTLHKELVKNDIDETGIPYDMSMILVEPKAKNTLPAIYAGVHEILKRDDDIVVVFPADHMILKNNELMKLINKSIELASDSLVTIGIEPKDPNTGYGYIAPGLKIKNGFIVSAFVEKPDLKKAREYMKKGYYWNSGIFMFKCSVFSDEVKKLAPDIFTAFESSSDLSSAFSKIERKISIDYGILEKSSKVTVIPADIGWNDIGSFDSLIETLSEEKLKSSDDDEIITIDSDNNFVKSDKDKVTALIGVEDLIVIDCKDALLICKKGFSQKVGDVVKILKKKG